MGGATGFHANLHVGGNAFTQSSQPALALAATLPLALAVTAHGMDVKHGFCDIDANTRNVYLDSPRH